MTWKGTRGAMQRLARLMQIRVCWRSNQLDPDAWAADEEYPHGGG